LRADVGDERSDRFTYFVWTILLQAVLCVNRNFALIWPRSTKISRCPCGAMAVVSVDEKFWHIYAAGEPIAVAFDRGIIFCGISVKNDLARPDQSWQTRYVAPLCKRRPVVSFFLFSQSPDNAEVKEHLFNKKILFEYHPFAIRSAQGLKYWLPLGGEIRPQPGPNHRLHENTIPEIRSG
jgi:hypothetical protein